MASTWTVASRDKRKKFRIWVHAEEDFLMNRICGGTKDYGFELCASRRSMVAQLRYRGWGEDSVWFQMLLTVIYLFLSKKHNKWRVAKQVQRKDLGQRHK